MTVSRMASVSIVIAVALVGATGWSVASTVIGTANSEPSDVYGARLGLGASDLRSRFAPPERGAFRAAADALTNGDLALDWSADARTSPLRARFEFHSGLLVAIRATLPATSPLAAGPALSETAVSVLSRHENADQTASLTILAKDCPTHAAEVRRLLRGASTRHAP